jgi:hypothetical protein
MRRFFILALVTASVALTFQSRLEAQKQQQFFLSLIDGNGLPVPDLLQSEVTVSEDGVACKIVKFEPVDWPMRVQVLIDNSQAATNPITSLREGLRGLFASLPDGVEMSLYTTSPQPRPITRNTTDKEKIINDINLIAPDSGAGAFFDALSEAAQRVDREKGKAPHFPIILMLGTDQGASRVMDRDYQKLQENILKHGITIHIILLAGGASRGASGGAVQTEVGLQVTKLSGGKYDNITAATRLATLLPEFGARIAETRKKQMHQYRITYERPAKGSDSPRISAGTSRPGTPMLSLNGNVQ